MDGGFLHLTDAVDRDGRAPSAARRAVRMRRLAARERLYEEGAAVTDVLEVVQGAVLVVASLGDGRRQILDIVGPGRLFGLTGGDRHGSSAFAATSSLVCAIDLVTARRNPGLAPRIERETLAEIDRLRDLALLLGRKTALERVASFLLVLTGGATTEVALDLPVSRSEIGDHLGLTIETVSRHITLLERDGVIVREGANGLRILVPARLKEIARGGRPGG